VPERLFEAIYERLGEFFYIKPSDFFTVSGNGPGDFRAGYRIYGGNRGIVLLSDGVVVEFPETKFSAATGVTEGDLSVINYATMQFAQIIKEVLPEKDVRKIESDTAYHLKLEDGVKFEDVVFRGDRFRAAEDFGSKLNLAVQPGLRFFAKDSEKNWSCHITVEPSMEKEEGIFFKRDMIYFPPIDKENIELYFAEGWRVDTAFAEAFNLSMAPSKE